ncbi:COG3650 family protein [Erythrobacter dokdonensis]|uniref:Lipoprotein n=1 Tax=Erythrobacter dokdonensis DSW-74 TaxID=1300349 RepID=A0A1A7BJL2_9SPHN|nr:hypothetical protein [Erythrobacter dokdonensis]OBV11652.1 hypothetical protein I603_1095 [Erythrobacter dokdonensis DSW-74]
MICRPCALAALLLALSACTSGNDAIDPEGKTFDAVATDEVVTLLGNEPFWNTRIDGDEALWATPENPDGTRFAVSRFSGNNGLGFSGTLAGEAFTATLTPGTCNDTMSDRSYPFVATIALGGETLEGCGYTDRQPFTGDPAP